MMMRLGGGDVPAVDVIATIAIGIVTIYFTLRAASKILRAASLMTASGRRYPSWCAG